MKWIALSFAAAVLAACAGPEQPRRQAVWDKPGANEQIWHQDVAACELQEMSLPRPPAPRYSSNTAALMNSAFDAEQAADRYTRFMDTCMRSKGWIQRH